MYAVPAPDKPDPQTWEDVNDKKALAAELRQAILDFAATL